MTAVGAGGVPGPTLVVGATGQLGTAVVRRLTAAGRSVRAFVRPASSHGHLLGPNVELAFGDLRDGGTVDAACRGAETVIATANTVIPRGRYSFETNEGLGYENLLGACRRSGISRIVFMSVPVTPFDERVPTFRMKRRIEQRIEQSGIPFTVFRGSLFMDDWLALIGSSIPLRGAEAATLRRPFWFSGMFLKGVGRMIEDRGMALIPGSGRTRHAFVALDDVADFLAKAPGVAQARNAIFNLGGPEVLSWNEAVAIFARVLGRPVRARYAPAWVFRAQQVMLGPFSPAASNLMGMNCVGALVDTPYEMREVSRLFGVPLTSVEQFLRHKLSLPR